MKKEISKKREKNQKSTRAFARAEYGLISRKRSQITIFIIIAVVIVLAAVIIFFFRQPIINVLFPSIDPKTEIQSCAEDATKEALGMMLPIGGHINPTLAFNYYGTKINYLCYTPEDNALCITRDPVLSKSMEKEIESYISPKIEKCFEKLGQQLEKNNYKSEPTLLKVDLRPDFAVLTINKKISYIKNDAEISIDNFDTSVKTNAYDFAKISNTIVNKALDCSCPSQECTVRLVDMMMQYPEYKYNITSKQINFAEDVYTISTYNQNPNERFTFAVRNCVIPEL